MTLPSPLVDGVGEEELIARSGPSVLNLLLLFRHSVRPCSIKFVLALGLPSELDLKQQLWFQQAAQEAGFVSIHTLESSSCCFLSLLHSKTLQHRQQKLDTDQRIDDADDDDLLLHPGVYVSVDMGAFGPCASLIRRSVP